MTLFNFALILAVLTLQAQCFPPPQEILSDGSSGNVVKVHDELKKAEIIPTVVNDFIPSLALSITWSDTEYAKLGNTLKPKKLQKPPKITLHAPTDSSSTNNLCNSGVTYTLAMTDPDAPSRDNPEWSEMCHWIATAVAISKDFSCEIMPLNDLKDIIEYKPPGPPPKTGKHRYVFLIYAPSNGTHLPLNLTKPSDRQHWGTGKERHGVRDWATENELVPVAANFIYAQNKKQ